MRATNGAARHQMQKRIKKTARGFRGGRHSMYRVVVESLKRAEQQAFVGRKLKKRDYRRLWITRINIACRNLGIPYNRFIWALNKLDIRLDRRQLSELAINQPDAFAEVVNKAKAVLGKAA
jgi:large subunit ribosomal protein L20